MPGPWVQGNPGLAGSYCPEQPGTTRHGCRGRHSLCLLEQSPLGAHTTPEVAFLDCLWGCGVQGLTLMGLGLILAWPFHQPGGMGKSPRLSETQFHTWVSVGGAAGAGLELSSQGPEQAQG